MKKRFLVCLLAALCCLFAVAAAEDGVRYVVKCNDWVSLRATPSTKAARLAQVPLGARVTDCVAVSDAFTCCTYAGQTGYILSDYLSALAPGEEAARMRVVDCREWVSLRATASTKAARLAQVPLGAEVTNCALAANGFIACSYQGQTGYILCQYLEKSVAVEAVYDRVAEEGQLGNVRVVIEYGEAGGSEAVRATGYDFGGAPLWRKELVCAQRTELALVEGFFAGTPARPLVMLYAYGDGLTAIDPASGAEVWRVGSEQVNLGGSITHAVGADGTIYAGGYYGPEPVAISSAGEVLWQASTGSDIYWLYDIQVLPEGVLASYEMVSATSDGLFAGAVLYDLETGETLEVIEE